MRHFKFGEAKPYLAATLIFIVGCLVTDNLFTRMIVLRNDVSDSGRIQHLYLLNSNEMAIFGTSKVHGLDLGTNSFNYAMDGTSFALTDALLQIELAKVKTAPVVVELEFQDRHSLGDEAKLIPFVGDLRIQKVLEQFHKDSWRYRVPGIRYFGYYDWFFKDYLNERASVTRVVRGHVEFLNTPPFDPVAFNAIVQERLQMTNGFFPDDGLTRLLIGEIVAHPQRLFILVATPFHPSCYQTFHNADKLELFEKSLAAYPNVEVIDWSRMKYPDQAFIDSLHLRREQTADLSQKLRTKISQILRDRNLPNLVTEGG